jgi:hypothetical protein
MVTLEEVLVHPLFLLLIGAGVTSLLIPWFTKRWENRKKELEIKMDIVSKMTEIITYQRATALHAMQRKNKITDAEKEAYIEKSKKWYVESSLIGSKLQTYFPELEIRILWEDYYARALSAYCDAASLYYSKDPTKEDNTEDKKAFIDIMGRVRDYLSFNVATKEPIIPITDQLSRKSVHDALKQADLLIYRRGDKIVSDVLKLKIKVF